MSASLLPWLLSYNKHCRCAMLPPNPAKLRAARLSTAAALAKSGVAAPAAQAGSVVAPSSGSSGKKHVADPWKQPAVIDLKFGAALKSAKATRVSGRATRVSPWGSLLLVLYGGSFAAYLLARISTTISVHDKLFPYQVPVVALV